MKSLWLTSHARVNEVFYIKYLLFPEMQSIIINMSCSTYFPLLKSRPSHSGSLFIRTKSVFFCINWPLLQNNPRLIGRIIWAKIGVTLAKIWAISRQKIITKGTFLSVLYILSSLHFLHINLVLSFYLAW